MIKMGVQHGQPSTFASWMLLAFVLLTIDTHRLKRPDSFGRSHNHCCFRCFIKCVHVDPQNSHNRTFFYRVCIPSQMTAAFRRSIFSDTVDKRCGCHQVFWCFERDQIITRHQTCRARHDIRRFYWIACFPRAWQLSTSKSAWARLQHVGNRIGQLAVSG